MKRITMLLAFAPVSALAHGGHVALPEPTHDSFHAAPIAGVILVGTALVVALIKGQRE